jgi:hypothetical protein
VLLFFLFFFIRLLFGLNAVSLQPKSIAPISFALATDYVYFFNNQGQGGRLAYNFQPTPNVMSDPNVQAVHGAMWDDPKGQGVWLGVADSGGSISFSHLSALNETFVLDFDLHLSYPGETWLYVSDQTGMETSTEQIVFFGKSRMVRLGYVHGASGTTIGVVSETAVRNLFYLV